MRVFAPTFLAHLALAVPSSLHQVREQVASKYIVKFKDSTEVSTFDNVLSSLSVNVENTYEGIFNGFAATLDASALEKLRGHPSVDYVEEDSVVSIDSLVTEPTSRWNLARISHRARGATNYIYDDSAGSGTCVYIVGTGIETTHPQFGGRAFAGANFAGGTNNDGNGHGTAMAGVVGSILYGVAKQTTLIGVKVLSDNGSGTVSNLLSGLSWITSDATTRSCPKGVMVLVALGGGYSSAVNVAVAALVNGNKFVAVHAGNDASNVGNYSPASEPSACTVGGTAADDSVSSASNTGALLDIWAPGQSILTTYLNGGTATLSGSLAAAHVAGLGAYIASLEGISPSLICVWLQALSTKNVLTGVPPGTVNYLAYNGNGA
ncbi:hypothetical protein V2G26_015557 [Clonostachys chloroleuca]